MIDIVLYTVVVLAVIYTGVVRHKNIKRQWLTLESFERTLPLSVTDSELDELYDQVANFYDNNWLNHAQLLRVHTLMSTIVGKLS